MYDNYDYSTYETTSSMLGGLVAIFRIIMIISLIVVIINLVSQWKIYKKAGKKGWECLIPIYNIIVLLQIVELPMWYIALFFVPIANIYAIFKIYIELAHKFRKSTGFGVATVFFNIICLPILAFGKSNTYNGTINENLPSNNQNNNSNNNLNNLESSNNINYNNTQEPISFNPSINTEINSINPVSNQGQNIALNNSSPIAFNFSQEHLNSNQVQPLNVIPNVNTTPNIVENNSINNLNSRVNLTQNVSPSLGIQTNKLTSNVSSNSSNLNQLGTNIHTPTASSPQELNIIQNMNETQPTVENNVNNTLNNFVQGQATEVSNKPEIPSPMPFTPNQNIQNGQMMGGLNVIPNMTVNQPSSMTSQNNNNNMPN